MYEILIQQKYITFPVNTDTVSKNVCIYENGQLIFDFDCKIDTKNPKHTAYIDVSRFMGKTVEIKVNPEMEIDFGFSDTKELVGLWEECLRPKMHFTVGYGYNNDPNGLIYHKGVYHMFYQHNPCSNQWGNMHWGHAISQDLIHWDERDPALFPDELGTVFSGCAIEDKNNTAGFGDNAMLLYYTAAGNESLMSREHQFTQCLAYSTDGGKSFNKYSGNPIINHIVDLNRDPKVVWVAEMKKYAMVLYLTDDLYQIHTSTDLINWVPLQEIHIKGDKECPDLYYLMCGSEKKWILSGGADFYIVGHFTKEAFVMDSPERKLTYSMVSYAGQSFSGMTDGRVVRIWWDRNRTKFFDYRFSQQMSVPIEMKLEKVEDKYYLAAMPVSEIGLLYKDCIKIEDEVLDKPYRLDIGSHPLDISIKMPYVHDAQMVLTVFGAQITLDTTQNSICLEHLKMPLSLLDDEINLRVIVDTCSIEVFADNGKFCFSLYHISDFNLPYVEISSSVATKLYCLSCHILDSIH